MLYWEEDGYSWLFWQWNIPHAKLSKKRVKFNCPKLTPWQTRWQKTQDVMRLKPCKSRIIYWLCASIADVQSPSFGVTCPPSSFLAYTELGRFSAQVNWTEPVATDNSGVPPAVTSNYQPPQRLSEGIHVIMYTAVDQSGNTATCDFTVKVVGKRILACIVKFIYSYLFGFSLKL